MNTKQTTDPPSSRRRDKEANNTTNSKGSIQQLFPVLVVAFLSFVLGLATPSLQKLLILPSSGRIWNTLSHRKLQQSTNSGCHPEILSQFLHKGPVPGLHVVCWMEGESGIQVFPGAAQFNHSLSFTTTTTTTTTSMENWGALKRLLIQELRLAKQNATSQAWATFSPTGYRLLDEEDDDDSSIAELKKMKIFLVFQGGQWLWPGVRKGFQRQIHLDQPGSIATLETLSLDPLVLSVQGFLSKEECEWIQTAAEPRLEYSEVTLMDKDKGRPSTDWRTSQTTFLQNNRLPELRAINNRTASLVRIPVSHQEHAQVLRYGQTEKYDTHHDYFDPSLYQQDVGTLRLIQNGRRNRMATVFWYLSDVPAGGETTFPKMDGNDFHGQQEQACREGHGGLMVKPETGKVIIFYSMLPDGRLDDHSLHGACPVREGVKWAANKWVWNAPLGWIKE